MTALNYTSFVWTSNTPHRVVGSNQHAERWTSRRSRALRRKASTSWLSTHTSLLVLIVLAAAFYTYIHLPVAQAKEVNIVSPLPTHLEAPVVTSMPTVLPEVTVYPTRASQAVTARPTGYSESDIESYIHTIFGKDAAVAIAVSHGECNPANRKYPRCQLHTNQENSIGIFQINIESTTARVHWARIPGRTTAEKKAWLEDPYNNTLLAYWIYTKSGFGPWTAYSSGVYRKYL